VAHRALADDVVDQAGEIGGGLDAGSAKSSAEKMKERIWGAVIGARRYQRC
jgi:hypothetical protein